MTNNINNSFHLNQTPASNHPEDDEVAILTTFTAPAPPPAPTLHFLVPAIPESGAESPIPELFLPPSVTDATLRVTRCRPTARRACGSVHRE